MRASDHLCRNCGSRASHAHHVLPRSICADGVTESLNIIPLCEDCHRGWHDRFVTLYRNILTDEELTWVAERASEGWLDRWYPERPDDTPF